VEKVIITAAITGLTFEEELRIAGESWAYDTGRTLMARGY
jgi:hypothetical protein